MASSLTMRNYRTTIENALRSTLLLAYRARLGAAATVTALRTRPSLANDDESLVFVAAANRTYRFSPSSTAADDNDVVIKPADRGTKPGRWLKTTSTVTAGYLRRCTLFEGRDDEQAIEERLLSAHPALLISYEKTNWQNKSLRPGAILLGTLEFTILVASKNMRGETESRQGSPFGTESDVDPGTAAMLGDVRSVLTSYDMDAPFGLAGIGSILLVEEEPIVESLDGRLFVEELKFTVSATVTPDADTSVVALDDPYAFKTQGQLAAAPSGEFEVENYANAGWTVPISALATSIAAGAATIDGATVSIGATNKTFTANKATWRDIVAGAWVFTETDLYAPAPPVPTDGFRAGVTFTDATSVTFDAVLCSTLYDFGPADKVTPPLVESLALAPGSITGSFATTAALVATATFTDGSTAVVTGECDWSTTDGIVASVSQIGVVTFGIPGTAQIVARMDGVASPPVTATSTI